MFKILAAAAAASTLLVSPAFAQKKLATPSSSSGPCSISIFKNLGNPETFLNQLKACGASDALAALDDAKKQNDLEAQACLVPLADVVSAVAASDTSTGILFAMQKYRDARKNGMITACINYFNSTFGIAGLIVPNPLQG